MSQEERVRKEIEKLEGAREKLYAKREQARAEILLLESKRPDIELDRLLTAIDASDASPDIAIEVSDNIRESIARAEQAIKSADQAEGALILRLERYHAELAELEAQTIDRKADKVAKDLEEHTRKVSAALKQAEELDGVPYVSETWAAKLATALMVSSGNAIPADLPIRISRSESMQMELQRYRQEAAQIRARQVRSHGKAGGLTLDELLEQLRWPGIIAPAESEVVRWFEAAGPKAQEVWRKALGELETGTCTRIAYTLYWADGRINHAGSRAVVERVSSSRLIPFSQREPAGAVYGT